MLIRFRVQNFLSFKDEIEFSMIRGKTRRHESHIISGGKSRHDIDILRAGVLYGANASGKSNMVKAIHFARTLIQKGTEARTLIPVKPFKLEKAYANQPSKFEFEFRQQAGNYLYGFELDEKTIHAEWLYELRKTAKTLIFERRTTADQRTVIEFGNIKFKDKQEEDFLHFTGMGTRPNQLFLRESIDRNIKYFADAYNWFEALVIIFPETQYMGELVNLQAEDTQNMVKYLTSFGTGICDFHLQNIAPEAELQKVLGDASSKIKAGESLRIHHAYGNRHQLRQEYVISKNDNQEVSVAKLMFKHKLAEGGEVLMDADEESDGTLRLMDLIPILYKTGKPHLFIIDELDRSLHPNLCYRLIEQFLAQQGNTNQMIVTTHESNLLDLKLLRRDEIWFAEKNADGASTVYSLEEFTPRYDKDIQKGYLLGRFGAIPIIGKKSL